MRTKKAMELRRWFNTQRYRLFKDFVTENIHNIEIEALKEWLDHCITPVDINNLNWAINQKKLSLLKLWKE